MNYITSTSTIKEIQDIKIEENDRISVFYQENDQISLKDAAHLMQMNVSLCECRSREEMLVMFGTMLGEEFAILDPDLEFPIPKGYEEKNKTKYISLPDRANAKSNSGAKKRKATPKGSDRKGGSIPEEQDVIIKRIRELRETCDMTKTQLAKAVKVPTKELDIIDEGKRRVTWTRLELFAEVFGVSTDYLRGIDRMGTSEGIHEKKEHENYLSAEKKELSEIIHIDPDSIGSNSTEKFLISKIQTLLKKTPEEEWEEAIKHYVSPAPEVWAEIEAKKDEIKRNI